MPLRWARASAATRLCPPPSLLFRHHVAGPAALRGGSLVAGRLLAGALAVAEDEAADQIGEVDRVLGVHHPAARLDHLLVAAGFEVDVVGGEQAVRLDLRR